MILLQFTCSRGRRTSISETMPAGRIMQVFSGVSALVAVAILIISFLLLAACAPADISPEQSSSVSDFAPSGQSASASTAATEQPSTAPDDTAWRITVTDTSGGEIWSFSEAELVDALNTLESPASGSPGIFSHVYSTINNWPTPRFYAAEGYCVADILAAAGLAETAQTVTFRSADGYEANLTREQLFDPQYCYPHVNESGEGAERVYPLISYRWKEGTDDMGAVRDENPCLIIGQSNPFEHTNPVFVEDISEIAVSGEPCEVWPAASTFPLPGIIARGETVKLQHSSFGLVKLHYTLDGSDPTPLSPMYNPSTYQPELNVPIPIDGPTVIKVLVRGFGKADSEIAVFEFTVQGAVNG